MAELSSEKIADVEDKIGSLKRIRAGKKGSITKRAAQLKRIVSEGGSRSKLRYLVTALSEVHKATIAVNNEVLQLSGNDVSDVAWMEDVNFTVDDAVSEVHDYLEARENDPESTPSMTDSWIREHNPRADHLAEGTDEYFDAPSTQIPCCEGQNTVDTSVEVIGTSPGFGISEESIRNRVYATLGATGGLGKSTGEDFSIGFGNLGLGASATSIRDTGDPLVSRTKFQDPFSTYRDPTKSIWEQPDYVAPPPRSLFRGDTHQSNIPSSLCYSQSAIGSGVPGGIPQSGLGAHHARYPIPSSWASRGGARPRTSIHHPTTSINTSGNNVNPVNQGTSRQTLGPPAVLPNNVDAWIDQLDENRPTRPLNPGVNSIAPDVAVAFLVQQQLPRQQLPTFDGSPTAWVEFITKFRDVVHNQNYLNDSQRSLMLLQHLTGQPKRAVKQFGNDSRGYILSLKRLKYLFGQKSKIAAATLQLVTKGKSFESNDVEGLMEFYYTVSDCLSGSTVRLVSSL